MKKLNGFHLKLIATIAMLIDHIAAVVFARMLGSSTEPGYLDTVYVMYQVFRSIGRFAFPIYCFLLVEGFYHTRSRRKYIERMAIFALVSEIPFDLAFNHKVLEFSYNNVYFTLLLGLLTITGLQYIKEKLQNQWALELGAMAITVAGFTALGYALHTDYAGAGVLAITAMYFLYPQPVIAMGGTTAVLGLSSSTSEFYALAMMLPMACYNGQRGKQWKYFFYAFYPVHLLLLDFIVVIMGMKLF